MTANRTVDLKLAIWLCWDHQSHPSIYVTGQTQPILMYTPTKCQHIKVKVPERT